MLSEAVGKAAHASEDQFAVNIETMQESRSVPMRRERDDLATG